VRGPGEALVEILQFQPARKCGRRASERRRSATTRRSGNADVIKVPEGAASAAISDEGPDLGAGIQGDARLLDGRPRLPATGVWHHQGSGHIGSVDLEMECSAATRGRHAELDVIRAGGRYVDGVLHPLARSHIPDIVAAAGICRALNVPGVVRPVL